MSGNMAKYSSIAALTGLVIGLAGCSSAPVGSVHRSRQHNVTRHNVTLSAHLLGQTSRTRR